MSHNSLKDSFGEEVFQILTKIKMTQNKIGYLAAILKRYDSLFLPFICIF